MVEVKVLNVEDAVEVSRGKKKQDVSISDASGYCRCTLWESDIGKLEDKY